MHTKYGFVAIAGFCLLAGMTTLAHAQLAHGTSTAPTLVAGLDSSAPLNLTPIADSSSSSSSSSSSASDSDAAVSGRFDLNTAALSASQPPPRRRYGRPNYADSHTNADGSNKFAFMAGAGLVMPVQDTHTYLTPSYVFQVGAGRNFSKMFGVLAQFDYNHFGFQGSTLANQQNLYNSFCTASAAANGTCAPVAGLDGTSHVWSFTIDPTYTFYTGERSTAYAVAGVGFYHKTANFTVPGTGTYCDPYYGCYQYAANQTFDKYTSNAAGFNGGLGLTYKPSRFAGEKFYIEARYVFVDNSPKVKTNTNLYPPNANQTYYIPITFGLRF